MHLLTKMFFESIAALATELGVFSAFNSLGSQS